MSEKAAQSEIGANRPMTRIQRKKREQILDAALEVFSAEGFRGATLDRIAAEAGLSKPNLLYYYPSKEAVFQELMNGLLTTWLDPLKALDPKGNPKTEIMAYVRRKLEMSRDFPRESRLFANEIVRGAPTLKPVLETDLKTLVHEKAAVIRKWMEAGRIAHCDPVHLVFSIWALTQHYADFDVQVRAVLGHDDPFPGAEQHLETLFARLLGDTAS